MFWAFIKWYNESIKKLLVIVALLFIITVERQFFDESVRCLEVHSNCEGTPGSFKDDELDAPGAPYWWLDPSKEDSEPVEGPFPFGESEPEPIVASLINENATAKNGAVWNG